jgi:PST family polysaccharide transporter
MFLNNNSKTTINLTRENNSEKLKNKSLRGGTYTLFAQGVIFIIKMGSTAVLARMLVPEDFGLVAMVVAITGFGQLFKDAGLSTATVQSNNITQRQISSLFWINISLGLCITVISFSVSPFIAKFYNETRLININLILALNFFFSGLTIQHQALLRRQMYFGKLAVVQITATVISSIIGVSIGLLRADYWALVWMNLSLTIFTALGCWIACPWMPNWPVRTPGTRRMLYFGLDITGFNFVTYISQNIDKALLGKFIGAAVLGLYSKSYQLVFMVINQIRMPLFSVALSGLSSLQDEPDKFRAYYLFFLKNIVSIIIFPVSIIIIFAEEIIYLLLGHNWIDAAPFFRILAIATIPFVAMTTADQILVALGKTKKYLKLGIYGSLVTIFAISIGISFGAKGVAIMIMFKNFLIMIPFVLYCFKDTKISLSDFISAIMPSFFICTFVSLFVYLIKKYYFNCAFEISAISCEVIIVLSIFTLYYVLFLKYVHKTNVFALIKKILGR